MVRALKDVRNASQLNKNLISVGDLEARDLRETFGEGILKVSSGSLVVLKGIHRYNLYYLIGSTVTKTLTILEYLKEYPIRL